MRVTGADALSPVARFSIALAVILAIAGITLAAGTTVLFGRYVEGETARFTEDAVGSHFGTLFENSVFERQLTADERNELEAQVVYHFSVYGILATRFYEPNGRIVFSYESSEIGRTVPIEQSAALQSTIAGSAPAPVRRDVVADMRFGMPGMLPANAPAWMGDHSHGPSARQPDVRRAGTLETWVPVMQGGETIGAAVVWRYIEPIDAALRQIQAVSAGIIAFAALLLWLVLRGVYVRSSKQIVAQSKALVQALAETERTYDATLHALSNALDVRDTETEGHARRVVEYMELIAEELGLPVDMYATLRRGALLHDIGKIGVPDHVLRKPGPLTDAEWVVMRKHPDLGAGIIEDIPFLEEVAIIVRAHHERWDGRGYPDGLAGNDIPLGARIFAVADSFDAMTSDRPYRLGRPMQEALGEIVGGRGTQFDPQVCDAFLRVARERLASVYAGAPHSHHPLIATAS
jgi:putative nucleotidyltransferase with HDIG domain